MTIQYEISSPQNSSDMQPMVMMEFFASARHGQMEVV
jgi:hypothetical protein